LRSNGTPEEFIKPITQLLQTTALDDSVSTTAQLNVRYTPVEPHYQKQTKIPEAHRGIIEQQIQQWIALGLVRKADSLFNTPLICIQRPGGHMVVQDFRELNQKLDRQTLTFKSTEETLGPIEAERSQIFSTLDLSGPAWQLELTPQQQEVTAFSFPGWGQFQWVVAPPHLGGAAATFHRLLDLLLEGIPGVIVHVDRIVIHSADVAEHLWRIEETLLRLKQRNLRINLQRSRFMHHQVHVMGFLVDQGSIRIHPNQERALRTTPMPTTMAMLKSFLGLANFFRGHIRNYAELAAPLSKLTQTRSGYVGGPMPNEAQTAFIRLRNHLTSTPVLTLPRNHRQYAIIIDASTGTATQEGGIGAILTQMDQHGKFYAICYASRLLQDKEKTFSPYLLEMAAAVWAI
jgi:hypothetical protein